MNKRTTVNNEETLENNERDHARSESPFFWTMLVLSLLDVLLLFWIFNPIAWADQSFRQTRDTPSTQQMLAESRLVDSSKPSALGKVAGPHSRRPVHLSAFAGQ